MQRGTLQCGWRVVVRADRLCLPLLLGASVGASTAPRTLSLAFYTLPFLAKAAVLTQNAFLRQNASILPFPSDAPLNAVNDAAAQMHCTGPGGPAVSDTEQAALVQAVSTSCLLTAKHGA